MIALDVETLRALSPTPRFVLLSVLTAVQETATELDFRLGDGWVLAYQRIDGRDWELLPPPDEVTPELKPAVRSLCRLVRPDRPDTTFTVAPAGATVESPEVGWLTVGLGDGWLDVKVDIDPTEPGGYVRFSLGVPGPVDAATAVLNAFYESADEP